MFRPLIDTIITASNVTWILKCSSVGLLDRNTNINIHISYTSIGVSGPNKSQATYF